MTEKNDSVSLKPQQEAEKQEKIQEEKLIFSPKAEKRFPSWAQLQYLPRLLQKRERWTFWAAMAVVILGFPFLGVRAYFAASEVVPQKGGAYTEAMVGIPQYINPLLSSLSDVDQDISEFVFSSMFRYDDQQQLQSDLVTDYVISEDQLTYSFFLRNDAQWHDGEQLDVDDVVFTIRAIQDRQYQSPLEPNLRGVTVEKMDDFSFSLTLPEKYAPFLTTLTFGIVPEHLWFNVPPQNIGLTELNLKPIGTGPYAFKELVKDRDGNIKSITVERFDEYYTDVSYLHEIKFLFFPDRVSAVAAVKEKRADGVSFISKEEQEEIADKNSNIKFHTLRIPQYTAVFFNQKQSAVLKDDDVRRALAHGVTREQIIADVFDGAAEEIYTPILPGYVGHNTEVEKYIFDVEQSKQILEDAGWTYPETESDAFVPRQKDGTPLEFTISTVDLPEYEAVLAILQEHWAEIGVKVNVDLYSPEDIQAEIIKDRNYEALLFGEIVGVDPDPYPFWHSSQQDHPGLALSIFKDDEADQLMEEARETNNDEERRIKYLHFQNNIAEGLPAIFLYNPLYTYAVHEKVLGITDEQYITSPADRFAGVTSWYINTKRTLNSTE